MINSRDIDELDGATAAKCRAFIKACVAQGIKVLITSTFRDKESQDAIYAQGRTAPGGIVTNAKGGSSIHQYRRAFDFCPYAADGKTLAWNDATLFASCGKIGESVGLEWGGSWVHFKDQPHMQNLQGETLASLQSKFAMGYIPSMLA